MLPGVGYMSHVTFLRSEKLKILKHFYCKGFEKETMELYSLFPEEIKNRIKDKSKGDASEPNSQH